MAVSSNVPVFSIVITMRSYSRVSSMGCNGVRSVRAIAGIAMVATAIQVVTAMCPIS